MMRRLWLVLWLLALPSLAGCNDRLNLEDITLSFMLGIDLDKDNHLVHYISSPVFSREAKQKSERIVVKAKTPLQARSKFDAMSTGLTVGGKVQVLLLGKSLLQHEDWHSLLDVMYRNSKFAVNARIAVVDGPLDEIFNFYPKDKPRLSLHLTELIDTANRRNITVKTTLQELHRQMLEKGVTPSMTELKKEKSVKVTGTALLNERGKYMDKITLQESALLKILQHREIKELAITVSIPDQEKGGTIPGNMLTITPGQIKSRIKPSYAQGRFHFDIDVKIVYYLTERLAPFNVKEDREKMERSINEQLERQFRGLFRKMQKHRIDPVGLGLYARAYEYKQWKLVQNHWGDALADAVIKVNVKTEIKSMGPVK